MFGLSRHAKAEGNAHTFTFDGLLGTPVSLADYSGQLVLVVNTASRCGFTGQYEGLQSLWESYRDQGLIVLGVPSNDFRQELATEEAVADFCEVNFNIDFPMTTITNVSGGNAHPFYRWANGQAGILGQVRWNFHKFLIGPDGNLLDWFSTMTDPDGQKIRDAIERALAS